MRVRFNLRNTFRIKSDSEFPLSHGWTVAAMPFYSPFKSFNLSND